jgi:hypothetical protein
MLYDSLSCKKGMKIIKGAEHLLREDEDQKAIEETLDEWLDERGQCAGPSP